MYVRRDIDVKGNFRFDHLIFVGRRHYYCYCSEIINEMFTFSTVLNSSPAPLEISLCSIFFLLLFYQMGSHSTSDSAAYEYIFKTSFLPDKCSDINLQFRSFCLLSRRSALNTYRKKENTLKKKSIKLQLRN